ncbi:MAG: hypothetical protein ACK4OM_06000 [Alphaproteobacteria bacterium]
MTENNFTLNFEQIKIFTIRLAEILHIENKLLKQFKINQANAMAPEKNEIVTYLDNAKKSIISNAEIIETHNRALIEEIVELNNKLNEVTEENFKLITRASLANKKLIEILRDEILKNTLENKIYNNTGSFAHCDKQANMMPALTLTDLV